jgi:O-antigen/teichoic acid export membrane protein
MELARSVVRGGVFAVAARWRPGFAGRIAHFRETARFNGGILLLKTLQALDKALPRALIGGLMGPAALGLFALASRLYEQVNAVLVDPISALATPVTARARREPETLRRLLEQAMDLSSALAYPAFLGVAATAPVLVPLAFGRHWAGAVPVVQVMMLLGLRSAVSSCNGGVLRGLGRPDLQVRVVAVGAALTAVLAPAAAPFGATAAAAALVVRGFATWPLGALYVRRLTGFPMSAQFSAGARSLAAAALMAAAVSALLHYGEGALRPELLLAASIGLGAAVYAGALAIAAPRLAARALDFAVARLRRAPRTAGAAQPQ